MRRHHPASAAGNNQVALGRQIRVICKANFNTATCVNLIIMTAYYLIFVMGADHVKNAYGVSMSIAGLTSGIMVIGSFVGRFMSGILIGPIGYRPILMASMSLFAVINASLLFYAALPWVFAARFAAGICVGMSGSVTATIVARVIPPECKGLGISLFSMSMVLALALGPFIGIALSALATYQQMLGWIAVITILSLSLLTFFHDLPVCGHKRRPLGRITSYLDPRVIKFSVMIFVSFMGYGCLQAFIAIYAKEFGLTLAASLFFPLYAAAAFASRPFTGRWLDNHGEIGIVYAILLLLSLAFLIICLKSSAALLLAACLFGLGYGNLQSIGQAVAISLVTPSRYTQAITTFFMFMDLGIGVGPYVFGFVIHEGGYEAMYLALSALSLLALALYYIQNHRKTAA